jgi:hypothetical protein
MMGAFITSLMLGIVTGLVTWLAAIMVPFEWVAKTLSRYKYSRAGMKL